MGDAGCDVPKSLLAFRVVEMIHLDVDKWSGHLLRLRGEELAGDIGAIPRNLEIAAGAFVNRVGHPRYELEDGHHDVSHVEGRVPDGVGVGGAARGHRVHRHSLRKLAS